jgi:hypothetical protein
MSAKFSTLPANSSARYGCYLGFIIGLGLILYGLKMLQEGSSAPIPYQLGVLATGVVQWVVCYYALGGNRTAWAFALSLNGTLGVAFFFGAPKVRDGWEISLALGFLPAVVLGVTTTLLAMSSEDY